MIDGSKIGQVALELMEQAEVEFPQGEVVDAAVVIEVKLPPREGEETSDSQVMWRQTSERRTVAAGLFSIAHDLASRDEDGQRG